MVEEDCFLAMKKKKEPNPTDLQKKQNSFKLNFQNNNRNQLLIVSKDGLRPLNLSQSNRHSLA